MKVASARNSIFGNPIPYGNAPRRRNRVNVGERMFNLVDEDAYCYFNRHYLILKFSECQCVLEGGFDCSADRVEPYYFVLQSLFPTTAGLHADFLPRRAHIRAFRNGYFSFIPPEGTPMPGLSSKGLPSLYSLPFHEHVAIVALKTEHETNPSNVTRYRKLYSTLGNRRLTNSRKVKQTLYKNSSLS